MISAPEKLRCFASPSPRPAKLREALLLRRLIKKYRLDCMVGAFAAKTLMLYGGRWVGVPKRVESITA